MQLGAVLESMITLRRELLYALVCRSLLLEAQKPVTIQITTDQVGYHPRGA